MNILRLKLGSTDAPYALNWCSLVAAKYRSRGALSNLDYTSSRIPWFVIQIKTDLAELPLLFLMDF